MSPSRLPKFLNHNPLAVYLLVMVIFAVGLTLIQKANNDRLDDQAAITCATAKELAKESNRRIRSHQDDRDNLIQFLSAASQGWSAAGRTANNPAVKRVARHIVITYKDILKREKLVTFLPVPPPKHC